MDDKYLKEYKDRIQTPQTKKTNTHTWFVYVIRLIGGKTGRDKLIDKLSKEGISAKPYLPSIHLFSFYKKRFGYKKGDFPVSETVSSQTLALPLYPGLKEPDARYICQKMKKVL